MNEPYLLIMFLLLVVTIFAWSFGEDIGNSFLGMGMMVLSPIVLFFMLIISGVSPIGDSLIETKPATNVRVGDELIIQATGFPTQNVTNIKLIDKKVQVRKEITRNAWGGDIETIYTVEEVPVIEKP